jgi:hypothetical protein
MICFTDALLIPFSNILFRACADHSIPLLDYIDQLVMIHCLLFPYFNFMVKLAFALPNRGADEVSAAIPGDASRRERRFHRRRLFGVL